MTFIKKLKSKTIFKITSWSALILGAYFLSTSDLLAADSPFDHINDKADEGLKWVLTKLTSFVGTIYLVIKFIQVMNGRGTWDELLKALFIIVGISSAAVIVDWLIISVS